MRDPYKVLIARVRSSAKTNLEKGLGNYGRKVPLEVNIDIEYLKEQFKRQGGCCPQLARIGIRFEIDLQLVFESKNCLTASVDRIDSNFGYIKGNVIITIRMLNLGKQDIPNDEFLRQLNMVLNPVTNKTIKNKTIKNNTMVKKEPTVMAPMSESIDVMRYLLQAGSLNDVRTFNAMIEGGLHDNSKHIEIDAEAADKAKAKQSAKLEKREAGMGVMITAGEKVDTFSSGESLFNVIKSKELKDIITVTKSDKIMYNIFEKGPVVGSKIIERLLKMGTIQYTYNPAYIKGQYKFNFVKNVID